MSVNIRYELESELSKIFSLSSIFSIFSIIVSWVSEIGENGLCMPWHNMFLSTK